MNKPTAVSTLKLPESAANYWVNLLCVLAFFAVIFGAHTLVPNLSAVQLTVIALLATVIPIWMYDIGVVAVYNRSSTGLKPGSITPINHSRVLIKLTGLLATLIILFSWYALQRYYLNATFLNTFFEVLAFTGPWIVLLIVPYFYSIDRRQNDPYDEYWQVGCLVTGRGDQVNGTVLKEYIRVWLIKGFFIPYVTVLLVRYVELLIGFNWTTSFFTLFTFGLDLLYTVDIMYAVLGYALTCRYLDTHIRSTEPTFLGWLVCLICYGAFHQHFGIGLLEYDDGVSWNTWLQTFPVSYYIIGATIIGLTLIYSLATVAIGYRMSNLTYRGIITTGPYRFSKHPAYVAKVASWWLISLPFLSLEGPMVATQHTLALVFISIVYFLRARTEENHLSNYPEYVQYAEWINTHGALNFINKVCPYLKYSKDRHLRWGSRLRAGQERQIR